MASNKCAIGVDLGGRKLVVSLVDETGRVHACDVWNRSLPVRQIRRRLLSLGFVSLLGAPARAQESTIAPSPQPAPTPAVVWSGTVELYGYLPWLQSTTTVRGCACF